MELTYDLSLWCRIAWRNRRGQCVQRQSSSDAAVPQPARCRDCAAPQHAPWCWSYQTLHGISPDHGLCLQDLWSPLESVQNKRWMEKLYRITGEGSSIFRLKGSTVILGQQGQSSRPGPSYVASVKRVKRNRAEINMGVTLNHPPEMKGLNLFLLLQVDLGWVVTCLVSRLNRRLSCHSSKDSSFKQVLSFTQQRLTWSLTFAVSSGNVKRSAMQAAVPAPINFTVAVGGTSPALNPTMFNWSRNHRNVKGKA